MSKHVFDHRHGGSAERVRPFVRIARATGEKPAPQVEALRRKPASTGRSERMERFLKIDRASR